MTSSTVNLPDMRGIRETAERSGLPEHLVRQWVITGKVVAVRAGRGKYYVNQQSLIDFLNTGTNCARSSEEVTT